jgi:hypothetical protein
MNITPAMWKRIEAHYKRPCELDAQGEIVYKDVAYIARVGYIAEGEYEGWLVDTTGDSDKLVCYLNGK